jgi:outer membrane protein
MNWGIAAFALQTTLISVLFGSNAFAADLIEVWQAAKGHDPEYLAAQSDQSAGEARRDLGDTLLKPSVNLVASAGVVNQNSAMTGAQFSTPSFGTFNNANLNTSINSGTQTKYAIQASQPLYDRELSAQKGQLQLSADVTDMGMVAADRKLIYRVAESYFETLKVQATIDLLIEQQNAVANTYAEISKRQHLGDASKIDLQETAEQVEAIKSKLLNVRLAYNNNLLALTELTGQNIKINSLERNFNSADISTGNAGEWISKAKLKNPQLKILALQEQIRNSEIEKYNSGFSPKVNLIAQLAREKVNGSGDYGSASNTGTSNMIAIQLSVPLTDGYRSAKKAEAFHLAKKAKREYEHAALEIEKQINSTWFALNTGRDRIESLTRIVALSRDRLDATERNHRQGSRTTLELLGAQSDYISSKLVLLDEQVNLIVNRIRLASIAGEISEQDLILANRFITKN